MRSFVIVLLCVLSAVGGYAQDTTPQEYQALVQLSQKGNYNDAYKGLRALLEKAKPGTDHLAESAQLSFQCLRNLNRVHEIDAWREILIKRYAKDWRVLHQLAQSFFNGNHYGYLIKGEFRRGHHRGGGQYMYAYEQDRVRGLQLMLQAHQHIDKKANEYLRRQFYVNFSQNLIGNRGVNNAWKLQMLTDIKQLPDLEKYYWHRGGSARGAPVDKDGKPIFYASPKSWDEAKNDGQRWRWCLDQLATISESAAHQALMRRADFCQQLFGVQTMNRWGIPFSPKEEGDDKEHGPWSLDVLPDGESIAKLANGVRRFTLEDDFNYIALYKQMAEGKSDQNHHARSQLANIYLNRRQYPKALTYYRLINNTHQIQQITGNLGRFESAQSQTAGAPASVDFKFRNGTEVTFTAHQINVPRLLNDVKTYIKSKPKRLEWDKINISNIGYQLIHKNRVKYIGNQVAQWNVELDPSKEHFDRRITVQTPLTKAGAYLLEAKMKNGNTCYIIMWLNDTIILHKRVHGKQMYYVADARTGEAIDGMNVSFFGYRQEHKGKGNYIIHHTEFAEHSSEDGLLYLNQKDVQNSYQWLAIARDDSGRMAYLGFQHIWFGNYHWSTYQNYKNFFMTDRPVYRPGQTVNFKVWLRQPKYDQQDVSVFAKKQVTLLIHNGKNEKVHEKQYTCDEYGGFDGSIELGDDANLGQYRMWIKHHGSGQGHFRVEEYKKPEFEVTVDAPKEPIALGEKFTATIKANYYFGAPVTDAKVVYKVHRQGQDKQWYPAMPWDWFYGKGYWWYAPDYNWYPGFREWGCRAPYPWWWHRRNDPPELLLDNEVEIGKDGTVQFEIDTSLAKAMQGDRDHVYTITAEVVDRSRRTIVGSGSITAARKPFQVTMWLNSGYYRKGDTIHVNTVAQTIDNKPVEGAGVLKLFKITYDDKRIPKEEEVGSWKTSSNPDGKMKHQLTAGEKGQYRLSYVLTDKKGRSIEGAYLFNIIGDGAADDDFKFNDIEIILDKQDYKVGDKVNLLINADRRNQQVLLFIRPVGGMYHEPQMLTLSKRSTVVPITIETKDMPNIFVEAVCVSNGRVHQIAKEIIVPPASRVLGIDIEPSKTRYLPGEKAEVTMKVTGEDGKPFIGSTVVAIYDKALEYIAGGSNVGEIKSYFWKWRRHHNPQTYHNAMRYFRNLVKSGGKHMSNLGAFGHLGDIKEKAGRKGDAEGKDGGAIRGERRMRAKKQAGNFAAPAASLAMDKAEESVAEKEMDDAVGGQGGADGPDLVEPQVRSNFADTALWVANITTDANGHAKVQLDMPENLTTWMIKVWAMGHGTRVGQGENEVITSKNLIIRMQAPRFFVEKDEVVLSANVHNYLDKEKEVSVQLELDGNQLKAMDKLKQTVKIAAGGEARINWRVNVENTGEAVIRMKALSDEESDAMEMKFPVKIHGIDKTESFSVAMRPDQQNASFSFEIPEQRLPEQSHIEFRYSPTLAGAMVDALPYMLEYPYGCTEQTLNRFIPSVITQRIILDMGLELADIRDKQNNLNAQEIGDPKQRAAQWKRRGWKSSPVFDEAEMQRIVKKGVQRLTDMQLSDGGWGWFSGWGEQSTPHTTATVVHGLQVAKANKIALVHGILDRGVMWLRTHQEKRLAWILKDRKHRSAYNTDALVFMVLTDAGHKDPQMQEILFEDRLKLSVYSQSMLGLAFHKLGDEAKWKIVKQNIEQYLKQDEENQTAWLNLPNGGYWWYWYGSEIEAHAYYLKLLAKVEPKSQVASRLVKYMLNNRRNATYWNSTRDTALCIEALADYMRASGEDNPNVDLEILYDGKVVKTVHIDKDNLFSFDNVFSLSADKVTSGKHTISVRKKGETPLYTNAYVSYFTKEDHIKAAGLEVKVERHYYKLVQDKEAKQHQAGAEGQVIEQKKEKWVRHPIKNLDEIKSGDLVEIELTIHSKNDYEYIAIEDLKAAGFEPVDQRSGYINGGMRAYRELRDDRVTFFVQNLARGSHSVSYKMRAEIPGKFSALPSKIYAMYAPELRGNADEIKIKIADKE